MEPHKEHEAPGSVSELAKRIRPFAGESADIAAQLLFDRFGSPARLLNAPAGAILDVLKDSPALALHLIAARDFADFAARAIIAGERVNIQSGELARYLIATIGTRPTETVLAIYVDRDDGYLADEVLAMGTESTVEFPTRLMIARALELGARGIILAHNHPSGLAWPSDQDREITEHIRALAASLGLALLDHLIVARGRIFSMAKGALQ